MIRKMQVVRKYKLKCFFALLFIALLSVAAAISQRDPADVPTARARLVIPREPNAAKRTFALLFGIPQRGSALGYPRAPVTLQFFGDLQCRDSRQVMLGALPHLIRHWVRVGKLRIVYRSLETDTENAGGYPEFLAQQGAALAAARQDISTPAVVAMRSRNASSTYPMVSSTKLSRNYCKYVGLRNPPRGRTFTA
jgi:hypothetical protein